jgi:hypothetical protein
METTTASMVHASTSPIAALPNANVPSRVRARPPFLQDPRQHGKRGDRHRGAHEGREGEPVPGRIRMAHAEGEGEGEDEPEAERHRHGRDGDRDGGRSPAAQQRAVDLEPDDEHEQRDAEIGQGRQRGPDVRREERVADGAVRERRADQDANEDLADHRGLPQPPRQRPEQLSEYQDDREIEEHQRDLTANHRVGLPSGRVGSAPCAPSPH